MDTRTLEALKRRDRVAMTLRINRQDIAELIRSCRWVIAYRSKRTDVHADYLRTLRFLTEAQALADEIGMGDDRLALPLIPLPISNNNFHWGDVLDRVCPQLARAA